MSVLGALRLHDSIYFNNDNTFVQYTAGNLVVTVGNNKALTIESDGGILHGSWNAQAPLTTSDRRLKTDIAPLQQTLRSIIPPSAAGAGWQDAQGGKTITGGAAGNASSTDGALWLLRQLRPVSYSFSKGVEAKYMRFGFLADELESVVPQLVRNVGSREVEDQKAVVYQDLIALLAAAAQSQQTRLDEQHKQIMDQEVRIEEQQTMLEELQKALSDVFKEVEQLKEEEREAAEAAHLEEERQHQRQSLRLSGTREEVQQT